jgi:hypothetical protein
MQNFGEWEASMLPSFNCDDVTLLVTATRVLLMAREGQVGVSQSLPGNAETVLLTSYTLHNASVPSR